MLRKAVYWALWPVEQLAFAVERVARLFWMLIIVTNPVFLAIYLMRRRDRDKEQENPT